MKHVKNAKKTSETLKEETKKMNEKLQLLRSMMETGADTKKVKAGAKINQK